VLGIDFVDVPIREAREKAEQRGLQAEFLQMDALELTKLDRSFDSVIDCGFFHVLCDEDRRSYVAELTQVTRPGSGVFLMCFSDKEPGDTGPRRVSELEIRQAFAEGWAIESITATNFEPNPEAQHRDFSEGGPKAWFAIIRRE
jgi:cyclopropane fatty-acyl-phospholipid synthase-like methyltransferase